MTDKLLDSKTTIETGHSDNFIAKEFVFEQGQEIKIHLPLKVFESPDASLGDLHDAAVQRAIDLLQRMLQRGE